MAVVMYPHLLTVSEAAQESGLSEYRIRLLVKQGHIRFISCGRKILINAQSLADYMIGDRALLSIDREGIRRID